MRPIRESLRIHIRRLYFTERLSFEQIARRLDIPLAAVRSAIVIDGGAPVVRTRGPYHQPAPEEKSK